MVAEVVRVRLFVGVGGVNWVVAPPHCGVRGEVGSFLISHGV